MERYGRCVGIGCCVSLDKKEDRGKFWEDDSDRDQRRMQLAFEKATGFRHVDF
jgi:hypothetical protein